MHSCSVDKLSGIISLAQGNGSFYAISQKRVWSQFDTWKRLLPKVKPFYAVKCNYNPTLLGWLYDKGAGFDCASAREIESVSHMTPSPEIIFANPCKNDMDIKSNSTSLTVVDSYEEIDKLQQNSWRGSSLIRIRVEDKGSKMPFSAKFGACVTTVGNLTEYAKVKGQHISGVSFHVGSGGGDVSQYYVALKQASHALCKINIHFTFGGDEFFIIASNKNKFC
jgi:ornithine decarboxylase